MATSPPTNSSRATDRTAHHSAPYAPSPEVVRPADTNATSEV